MIFFEDNFIGWTSGVNFKKLVTFTAGLNVSTGQTFQLNGLPIPTNEYVTSGPWAGGASPGASTLVNGTAQPIYTPPNDSSTWKITAISLRYSTKAAATGTTLNVEVASAGTAPGSGTNQMSSAILIDSTGTNNTVVNGTVTTQTTISNSTSVNLVPGGAATTSLAGLVVGIALQRQT